MSKPESIEAIVLYPLKLILCHYFSIVSLGEVTFDPAPDSYTVREGTAIPAILCNSECVPACKFEWFKDGRFLYESDGINFGEVSASRLDLDLDLDLHPRSSHLDDNWLLPLLLSIFFFYPKFRDLFHLEI